MNQVEAVITHHPYIFHRTVVSGFGPIFNPLKSTFGARKYGSQLQSNLSPGQTTATLQPFPAPGFHPDKYCPNTAAQRIVSMCSKCRTFVLLSMGLPLRSLEWCNRVSHRSIPRFLPEIQQLSAR